MLTAAARRSRVPRLVFADGVASRVELAGLDVRAHDIDSQVAAGRWRRVGPAVVLHNGPLTRRQRCLVAVINCGPRAVLTSFTAAEQWGLLGWDRDEVHVLAPAGTTAPALPGVVLHRVGDWTRVEALAGRRLQRLAPALLVAAAGFERSRPGCGLLAAAVQQKLCRPADLRRALEAATRTRHRRALSLAVDDIAQGAQALSEIDLGRLCRRHGLPPPVRQAVRCGPGGRRRYLDAEWRRPDGTAVAVEVDGAHHLSARQWSDDQLRQNEVVIAGTLVLRYPSVVVRNSPLLVAAQLRDVLQT